MTISITERIAAKWKTDGAAAVVTSAVRHGSRWRVAAQEALKCRLHQISAGNMFPWHGYRSFIGLPELASPIGMTTPEERAFLSWWTAFRYRGQGVIVELGPFVGASTVALATGLMRNPRASALKTPLRVYDRFTCSETMAAVLQDAKVRPPMRFSTGASCRDVFDDQTAHHSHLMDVHECDLMEVEHDDTPIELLFVDAMKTPALANRIVRAFYPSLSLRGSVLIQQDFVHYYTSWLHLVQYDLRDVFRFEHHVPNSASAVFSVVGSLARAAEYELDLTTWKTADIDRAFAYSLSLVKESARENIHAAKAMLYVHLGQLDVARDLVATFLRNGRKPVAEMQHVMNALASEEILK